MFYIFILFFNHFLLIQILFTNLDTIFQLRYHLLLFFNFLSHIFNRVILHIDEIHTIIY